MIEVNAYGLAVTTPPGWESRIFRRPEHGEPASMDVAGAAAPPGEKSYPVVHIATVPLPMDAADYGSDIVEELGRDDALIVLKEFDPASATSALFARKGMPRDVRVDEFDPNTLQRSLPGLAGYQAFFHERGRAFCLYVVLGSFRRRAWIVPRVNEVLATLTIEDLP